MGLLLTCCRALNIDPSPPINIPSCPPASVHLPNCQIGLPLAGALALYFDMGSRGLWIGIATMNLLQVVEGGRGEGGFREAPGGERRGMNLPVQVRKGRGGA